MIICLLYASFLTFFLILKPVLVFNPDKLRERIHILNKSENAILQLSIFCEKVLDKKCLLKLMPPLHLLRSSYDLFVYDFPYDIFVIVGGYKLRRM